MADANPWREDELALLRRVTTYREYVEAGGTRSSAAYHCALRRHRRADRRETMVDAAETVVGYQTVRETPPPDDYRRLFDLIKQADALKHDLSPTQESTDFHAPDDGLPIGIAYSGDWHLGATGVAYDRLETDLKTIGATPGAYVVGMGDYTEGVTLAAKAASSLFSGAFNARELQDWLVRDYADHARGKWLAWVAGNHDEWMMQATGYSLTDKQARYLGAPYFSQGGGTIFVHVGAERYVVAVTHNAKGNSRLNTTNAQRRTYDEWPLWENCDCIVCGHLHYNDQHTQTRKGGRCVYLRSGTAKLHDAYAADHGFKPEYGIPLAVFYPDEHRVVGFRGDDLDAALRFLHMERERYRRS